MNPPQRYLCSTNLMKSESSACSHFQQTGRTLTESGWGQSQTGGVGSRRVDQGKEKGPEGLMITAEGDSMTLFQCTLLQCISSKIHKV